MADDTEKAEELLKQSAEQKRHNSNPTVSETGGEPEQSLDEAVADAYRRMDDGEIHENLTVRDGDLAALIAGLEETGELETIGTRANNHLDRDGDADSRAAVLKALLRVGLQEVASEEVEAAKEGKRSHLMSHADEF